MAGRIHKRETLLLLFFGFAFVSPRGLQVTERPFRGVNYTLRQETVPRAVTLHVVTVNLGDPGIQVKLSPPGGTRETVRETTLAFLNRERAQVAINAHFFLPYPSTDPNADVIGLAASEGKVYSGCEEPSQSYAIVSNAPAINFDRANHASIVRCEDGTSLLWNTLAGSAQIITNGVVTIPRYRDAENPSGQLTPNADYSNDRSWYALPRARSAIGLTRDRRVLVLIAVEAVGNEETSGMTMAEVANVLHRDYGVYNAINLDGGGSTSLAIDGRMVTSGNREVATSLAIFAARDR